MSYTTSKIPQTYVGNSSFETVLKNYKEFDKNILVCISRYHNHTDLPKKVRSILSENINIYFHEIRGEPNPYDVDNLVKSLREEDIGLIIAVGGGSVIDFAKAVAGILPINDGSVFDYLEGVGRGKTYDAVPTPWIAVVTTPGTGAEVTKNAVLSVRGEFKKSFRDEKLIAKTVVLEPAFLKTIPKDALQATVMDGLTQLIESYTSVKNNTLSDALIESVLVGLYRIIIKLKKPETLEDKEYEQLILAGYYSGITLANCGLGIVHSFASPLGAYTKAPHGIVCARLLPICTKANISWLRANNKDLSRYEKISKLFLGEDSTPSDLVETLENIVNDFKIKKLSIYGLNETIIDKVVQETAIKTNPANLDTKMLKEILKSEL
jgi:alcohol dehydrogenase class IV